MGCRKFKGTSPVAALAGYQARAEGTLHTSILGCIKSCDLSFTITDVSYFILGNSLDVQLPMPIGATFLMLSGEPSIF